MALNLKLGDRVLLKKTSQYNKGTDANLAKGYNPLNIEGTINFRPETFEVSGETEKELIYDVYGKSEHLVYVLGEKDKLINEIWEAKTSKEEILKKIPFETLDKFLNFLSNKGDYRFRII